MLCMRIGRKSAQHHTVVTRTSKVYGQQPEKETKQTHDIAFQVWLIMFSDHHCKTKFSFTKPEKALTNTVTGLSTEVIQILAQML